MGKLAPSLTALALSAVAVASLAACDSEAATAPPPSPSAASTSPAPSASASATPTPPVMPEAAKTHTEAGAKTFVRYFLDAVTYAESTLDPSLVQALSMPTCVGCSGGIRAIQKLAHQHGYITGANLRAQHLSVAIGDPVKGGVVGLTFTAGGPTEVVHIPGRRDEVRPPNHAQMLITLVQEPSGWLVAEYEGRS